MKQKTCNIWSIFKKTHSYGFMLTIILFFVLSGCGSQSEYTITEHYNTVDLSVYTEAGGLDISDIETQIFDTIDTETGETETQEDSTSAEATEPAFDISSLVLKEVIYHDGLIHILDNDGRRGLLDGMGNVLVTPRRFANSELILELWGGNMPTQSHNRLSVSRDRRAIVNLEGEKVFPLPHMEIYGSDRYNISTDNYNLIRVYAGSVIMFFDLEGNEIGRFDSSEILVVDEPFHHSSFYVQDGVIFAFYTNILCQTTVDTTAERRIFDLQGNEITNRYYTSIGRFIDGFAPVEIGRPSEHGDWPNSLYDWDNVFWGLIDKQGNEVIPPVHWNVSHVVNGRVVAYSPRGFALLNTAGEYIIPFGEFDSIIICDQGIAIVGVGAIGGIGTSPSNQLIGLVDLEGNEIIPPRYNIIRNYWNYDYMRWGWNALLVQAGIHANIPPQHISVSPTYSAFIEGRAAVAYDGLWGYIDINGYEVIPLQFVYAGTFMNGTALVNVGGTRARPHTWQSSWHDCIVDTRHYSDFGGIWHLIDLYGNILETFEHEYMERINADILVFSNDISLSEMHDRYGWRDDSSHRGGRFTPLWDESGCIYIRIWDETRIHYNACIYITFVQMNIKNIGIIAIEPPPVTELLYESIFTHVRYFDGFVYVREERQNDEQSYRYGGLLDYMGNELIPMIQDLSFHPHGRGGWDNVLTHELSDGIVVASTAYGTGYIDIYSGEWVAFFPLQHNFSPNFLPFSDDVAVVGNIWADGQSMVGVINRDGKWVFEIARGYINSQFRYGLVVVSELIDDYIGWWSYVINTDGEIVFPRPHMEFYQHTGSIGILSPNLFDVMVHRRNFNVGQTYETYIRVFDIEGNVFFHYFDENHVTDNEWLEYHTFTSRFSGGYATFQTGFYQWGGVNSITGLFPADVYTGLINEHGHVVIPPRYDVVSQVFHGRVVAELGVRENIWNRDEAILSIALLNTSGEYIIPAERFHRIFLCPTEPVAVVAIIGEDGRRLYGIVDLYGNYIIFPKYDIIRHYGREDHHTRLHGNPPPPEPIFVEGRARVADGGRWRGLWGYLWGYIDTNGYEVIPPQFEYVGIFMNGIALVNYHGNWQLIDLYGNVLETFEHEFMARISANLLTFAEDDKKGIIRIIG